jgi:hypothetical protein
VVGVVASLAAPLVGEAEESKLAHVGYIAMVIGGALMLSDRVFVATAGWARLVAAHVALEDRPVNLLYGWKIRQLRRRSHRLTPQQVIDEWTFLAETADGMRGMASPSPGLAGRLGRARAQSGPRQVPAVALRTSSLHSAGVGSSRSRRARPGGPRRCVRRMRRMYC